MICIDNIIQGLLNCKSHIYTVHFVQNKIISVHIAATYTLSQIFQVVLPVAQHQHESYISYSKTHKFVFCLNSEITALRHKTHNIHGKTL